MGGSDGRPRPTEFSRRCRHASGHAGNAVPTGLPLKRPVKLVVSYPARRVKIIGNEDGAGK